MLGLGDDPGRGLRQAHIALEQIARIETALYRAVNGGVRIERRKACLQSLERLRFDEIGFGDDQPVRKDDLLSCLRRPSQSFEPAHGLDYGRDCLDVKFAAQRAIRGERLQDRPRIGEPARLDQYSFELRHRAMRALGEEIAQCVLQVGAHVAAQAAVAKQRDIVARSAHQRIVDADAPELVDYDRRAFAGRASQKATQ